MEASQDLTPAEGQSADGSPVAVGDNGLSPREEHEGIGSHDAHGSVTPRSGTPAEHLSGIPLDEDKDKGAQPVPTSPPPGAPDVAKTPGL